MLRRGMLALAGNDRVEAALHELPVASSIVSRYVPGETTDDAMAAAAGLVEDELLVTIDFLGEAVADPDQAETNVTAYLELLGAISEQRLARKAEVSVKLSAIGQALPEVGTRLALDNARRICRAARSAGTTVTIDAEDHTATDDTLATVHELRKDYPETGAVLQAYLRRSVADARALASEGSRVRLCKGAYAEPERVAYTDKLDVDRSYVRCLKVLMAGDGYPMVATHDPHMIAIACALATRFGRSTDTYELQMLYGIRPHEQRRLSEAGEQVRVYVPYGTQWYAYLMRRLAERPANLRFFLRSLVSRS